jgi:hypothetical protein
MTDTTDMSNWETEVCGGSGRYSFNMMDGDRCYGCNGKTRRMTRAGTAARQAWLDANTVTLRADEVAVGDVLVDSLGKRRTVVEVRSDGTGSRRSGDGPWEPMPMTLTTKNGTHHVYAAADAVKVWRQVVEAAPLAPVNTDRRAEMRAFVKTAKAATRL